MNRTALQWLGRSLAAGVAAAVMTACAADAPSGPNARPASAARLDRAVDLGACDSLAAPAGSKLVFRGYAEGVQIYRWTGTSWSFVAPEATLSADADGNGEVATHYAGPTWESNSGSKVVGAVVKRCPGSPNAIPWLLLRAVSAEGPGVFDRVTFIQRLNTVGGNAPATPGSVVGEEARVPYTALYLFYRAQ